MIFIILFLVIIVYTIVTIMRSGKPLKHIFAEAKYELIYNFLGGRALLEDLIMKKKNQTELVIKTGQIALVTGGSRGLGVEIVKMLMQCDMHVIIGCRNVAAGEKLESVFRKQGITTGEIKCFKLDVGSMKSVQSFCETIAEKYPKIHILVNNAGIMFGPYIETEDGFESQFAINYLGHFLLTHLLIPQLKAAGNDGECKARIVNVSSCAHLVGDIDFEDINMKEQYISAAAYAQSKLAQVLFTNYLDSLLRADEYPVQVHAVHPGVVDTELFEGTHLKTAFPWLPGLLFKNPVKGATPIIHACVSPKLEGKGGTYISNCKISDTHPIAKSVEIQEKFFTFTKNLLKIDDFGKVS